MHTPCGMRCSVMNQRPTSLQFPATQNTSLVTGCAGCVGLLSCPVALLTAGRLGLGLGLAGWVSSLACAECLLGAGAALLFFLEEESPGFFSLALCPVVRGLSVVVKVFLVKDAGACVAGR